MSLADPNHPLAQLLKHDLRYKLDAYLFVLESLQFAQDSLGDVVFIQLPDVGTDLTAGESFGEVESTKSVSDLYAPLSASVVAVNAELEAKPQLVNSDPYGQGWLLELRASGDTLDDGLAGLLEADAYRDILG